MSELIKSLEKSVVFLKERFPDGLPLLTDLENLLESLKAKKDKTGKETSSDRKPSD